MVNKVLFYMYINACIPISAITLFDMYVKTHLNAEDTNAVQ